MEKSNYFGTLLRMYREQAIDKNGNKMSRRMLGEIIGRSEPAIEKYEKGDRNIDPELIWKIGKALPLEKTQIDALVEALIADNKHTILLRFLEAKSQYEDSIKREREREEKLAHGVRSTG